MSRNVCYTVRSHVLSLHALTLWNTIILSFQYQAARCLNSYWNEPLRHWRSGLCKRIPAGSFASPYWSIICSVRVVWVQSLFTFGIDVSRKWNYRFRSTCTRYCVKMTCFPEQLVRKEQGLWPSVIIVTYRPITQLTLQCAAKKYPLKLFPMF